MVRAKKSKAKQTPLTLEKILTPSSLNKRTQRGKYERKTNSKLPIKLVKTPTIKTYLHVVECVNTTPKDCDKINKSEMDSVCPKINCVTDYYKVQNHNEIITDQPCQITERTCSSPVTPHRIRLDNQQTISKLLPFKSKKKLGVDESNSVSSIKEYFPVRRSNRKTKKIVLEEKNQLIKNAILNDTEIGLEIRYFDNKGRGIVTTQKFQRGDFVVEYRGELINATEAKHREQIYAHDQNTGCYMYYFQHKNRQYCVDATSESKFLGRLVNHSRNGNLITRIEEVAGKPHLVLVAKDDIDIGQEITYDYGDRSKESLKHHPWLAA